jgi:hypothetical protein
MTYRAFDQNSLRFRRTRRPLWSGVLKISWNKTVIRAHDCTFLLCRDSWMFQESTSGFDVSGTSSSTNGRPGEDFLHQIRRNGASPLTELARSMQPVLPVASTNPLLASILESTQGYVYAVHACKEFLIHLGSQFKKPAWYSVADCVIFCFSGNGRDRRTSYCYNWHGSAVPTATGRMWLATCRPSARTRR